MKDSQTPKNGKSPSRTGGKKTEKVPMTQKVKAREMVKANHSTRALWEGVEVPAGVKRDRMVHVDETLQRVRKLERNLGFNGKVPLPSAKSMAQELGVKSARTIRRLIEEMKDLYGLPIEWVPTRHGYRYTEDVAFLPFLQFSESELVAVYLTQKLGVFENTSFKPKLKSAFRKLLGLFGQELSFDPKLLDECFSFDAEGPHARFRPEHLDTCSKATLRREELVLTYVKQHGEGAGKPEVRRVQPLHVTYRDFAYYVVCLDPKRRQLPLSEQLRLFMVTRMQKAEETGVKFERPKDFDAQVYLEKAFKLYASTDAVEVVLHFSPDAAARVIERKWHRTQEFTLLDNGWTKLTMQVGLAPDLYSWIGGFFGDCRVVGPGTLIESMRRLHLEAMKDGQV
jgi:predicted DNA-binding transcriptional regulator YafY